MSINNARKWLIIASLSITAGEFVFFLIAPVTGYPLTFPQSIRLLEVVLPIFFGYLGSAARFIFPHTSNPKPIRLTAPNLSDLLVRGPVLVFGLVTITALAAFGYSNRISASPGTGMDIDMLAGILSIALGLLAVTTNVAVAYLFPSAGGDNEETR